MKLISSFWRSRGTTLPITLVASAFFALVTIIGITSIPSDFVPKTEMRIESTAQNMLVGETFVVEIIVESFIPVNVFSGEIKFDNELLSIKSIDYNTSVADLWAELPWYSNGAGTLNFGGGTTHTGGFQGTGTLIKVTFDTKNQGGGSISLHNPRILLHDGLGTDATLSEANDSVYTIENIANQGNNLLIPTESKATTYRITKEAPSTDLNNDGKQTIADISIFMLKITGNDSRYDFNLDGQVNIKDLNILLGA